MHRKNQKSGVKFIMKVFEECINQEIIIDLIYLLTFHEDSPKNEELTAQQKSQITAQQQRYNANDLYKPKFDFRSRRRGGQVAEDVPKETAPASN